MNIAGHMKNYTHSCVFGSEFHLPYEYQSNPLVNTIIPREDKGEFD